MKILQRVSRLSDSRASTGGELTRKGCACRVERCELKLTQWSAFCRGSPRTATWGDDKVAKEDLEEWAADWDDAETETGFDKKLRAEIAKHQQVTAAAAAAVSSAGAAVFAQGNK